jgi:hypothetical protein
VGLAEAEAEATERLVADYKNAETWLQLADNRILIPQFPVLSLIPFLLGEGIGQNSDLSYTYSQLGLLENLISDRHLCNNRDSVVVKCLLTLPVPEMDFFLTICECFTLCIWALRNEDNELDGREDANAPTIRNRKLVYSVQLPSKLRPPTNHYKEHGVAPQNRILCVPANHGRLVILSTAFSMRSDLDFYSALVVMNLEAQNEGELFGPVCTVMDAVFPLSLYRMSREQSDVDEKAELFSLDSIISEWSDGSIRAWRFQINNPIVVESILPVHLEADCLENHRISGCCASLNKQCQYIGTVKLADNRFVAVCSRGHCCLHDSITGKKVKQFQLRLQVNNDAYIMRTEVRDGKEVQVQSVRDGLQALAFGEQAVQQRVQTEKQGKSVRYMDIRVNTAISTPTGLLLTLDPRMKTAMIWSVDSEVCLLVFPVHIATKRFICELEPLVRDVAPSSPKPNNSYEFKKQ